MKKTMQIPFSIKAKRLKSLVFMKAFVYNKHSVSSEIY